MAEDDVNAVLRADWLIDELVETVCERRVEGQLVDEE